MKCCICGTVRECGKYLKDVFSNMEQVGKLFDEYVIILYYDYSRDNTLKLMEEYAVINPKFSYHVNKDPLSIYRTHRIAKGRNYCLQQIREKYSDYEYFAVMDCDDKGSRKMKINLLEQYLKNRNKEWDSLSFNYPTNYYDSWALSIRPFVASCNHFKERDIGMNYIKKIIQHIDKRKLIPCYSAFNGFAIYKTGGGLFNEAQIDFSNLVSPRIFSEILIWLTLMVPLFLFNRGINTRLPRRFAVGALTGYTVLLFADRITTFLVAPSFNLNANSAGYRISRADSDVDWMQSYLPARFVLAMLTFSMLFSFFSVHLKRPWAMVGFPVVIFAFVMPLTIGPLIQPTGRLVYEWTQEDDLAVLMKSVEFTDGVWLSSDLADSAQNFSRPMENYNLTALVGAQFYISGSKWNSYRNGFRLRVSNSQKFFGTRWSGWHNGFLSRNNIDFVLVRDRCPVVWSSSDFPGSIVKAKGDWLLLKVGGTSSSTQGTDRWFNASNVDALYGIGECRSFERVKN